MIWILLSLAVSVSQAQKPIVKQTTTGLVSGLAYQDHVAFKGIPYAEPPVGALRWQNPVPKAPWMGVLNTTAYSPGCLQFCELPPHVCPTTMSEDCLYLNVFAPAVGAGSKTPKPVMVFFAGGGFFQGTGGDILYDGRFLVNTSDVVVVTSNFRLGAMGFLVWGANSTGGWQIGGNYGLQDEILVLQWVQNNIANFGGDPTQVVVFGQSAGAMSIGIHLINPNIWLNGQRLFNGAIMESNPLGLPYKTQAEQSGWGDSFAYHIGCSTLSCLLSKDATDIVAAQKKTFELDVTNPLDMALLWTPAIDGDMFPTQPLAAFAQGLAETMPVIIGTTRDEGLIFVKKVITYIDEVEYWAFLFGLFGLRAFEVEAMYPVGSTPNADKSILMEHLITDYVFQCPTRNAARSLAEAADVHLYRFDRVLVNETICVLRLNSQMYKTSKTINDNKQSINDQIWGTEFQYCDSYVCHGEELPVVFNVPQLMGLKFTPAENMLVQNMQRYWTNFAKTLNPNLPKTTFNWPLTGSNATYNLVLDTTLSVDNAFNAARCDFWDTFYN